MQLSSQPAAVPAFRNFVASPPVATSGYATVFREAPAGFTREEGENQSARLFDILQAAIGRVDYLLQWRCIAIDMQISFDQRLTGEASVLEQALEKLLGAMAEILPVGGCIWITSREVNNQVEIEIKGDAGLPSEPMLQRLLNWVMGEKARPEIQATKLLPIQRLIEKQGGKMNQPDGQKLNFTWQIPQL